MGRVYLVMGVSRSGKTTLLKLLTKNLKKPIFILNDRGAQVDSSYVKVTWKDCLEKVKNGALIVEDIITLDANKIDILKELITFYGHHAAISPIYLVVHSATHSAAHRIFAHVDAVYLTGHKANVSTLGRALTYFHMDPQERVKIIKQFTSHTEKFGYFKFDVLERSFHQIDPTKESWIEASPPHQGSANASANAIHEEEVALAQRLKEKAKKMLNFLPNPDKANALFDLLIEKLLKLDRFKDCIDEDDLTITFTIDLFSSQEKTTATYESQVYVINIIDYVDFLIRRQNNEEEEKKKEKAASVVIKIFHDLITRTIAFPSCIINP
jgi:hypothetical protein